LLLAQEADHIIPRAGYDAVDDSIRGLGQSLFEIVVPSFSSGTTSTFDSTREMTANWPQRYA
jgi:hypothetical protein